MRRRPKAVGAPGTPPIHLLAFNGSTPLEAEHWLEARMQWWDATQDPDAPGDLQWLLDGHAQVPEPPFCGGLNGWCGSPGCACHDI